MVKSAKSVKRTQEEFGMDSADLFWKRYCEADAIQRHEMLKPIVKNLIKMARIENLPEKDRMHTFTTFLGSYLDDLESYMASKK